MKLEEFEKEWKMMNNQMKQQEQINEKLIRDVISMKVKGRVTSIFNYELIGAVILLISFVVLIANISVLDTIPLKISGVISILIMAGLPVLSIGSILRMKNQNLGKGNIQEVIQDFAKRRSQFLFVQRFGIALSGVLLFSIIPVTLKIANGKDFFAGDSNHLLWFIPVGLILLYVVAKWGYGCYSRSTAEAQRLIEELEEFETM